MEKGPKGAGKASRQRKAAAARKPTKAPPESALAALGHGGNDRVREAMSGASTRRDALLAFVSARAGAMRGVQLAEAQAESGRRRWFDEVARGKTGFGLPDPSRWAAPARTYRRAVEALCAGDLGRGVDLVRRAHEEELRALEAVPAQVDLPDGAREAASLPTQAAAGADGQGCPRTARPELIAELEAIERVDQGARAVAHPPARTRMGWWDREPEDDDPEAEGAKGRRAAAPKPVAEERQREAPGPQGQEASAAERTEENDRTLEQEAPLPEQVLADRARPRAAPAAPPAPETSPPAAGLRLEVMALRDHARKRGGGASGG